MPDSKLLENDDIEQQGEDFDEPLPPIFGLTPRSPDYEHHVMVIKAIRKHDPKAFKRIIEMN